MQKARESPGRSPLCSGSGWRLWVTNPIPVLNTTRNKLTANIAINTLKHQLVHTK